MTDITEALIPLSFPQQLLCVLDRKHGGGARGPRFIITMGSRLRGVVDEDALRAAVDDVVARHDALRSVICEGSPARWQVVLPPMPGRFTVVDLDTPDPADRDRRAEEFLGDLDAGAYPADTPPLLWVRLARMAPDDAVLALVAHHSVTDAWSMDLIVGELTACYEARLDGREPDLPPAGRFADYVAEDHARAQSAAADRSLEYWRKQLEGLDRLTIPADAGAAARRTPVKAKRRFTIPPDVTADLVAAGRAARCSPFITLLTAYMVLLHRVTGVADVAVQTLNSGRGRPERDHLIGYLLNAVPLRVALDGNPTLRECLARVRRTCLDAYRHELPLLRLLRSAPAAAEALGRPGSLTVPFQHLPNRRQTVPQPFGPDCSRQAVHRRASRQERGVAIPLDGLWTTQPDDAGGLAGTFNYAPDLVAEDDAASMVAGFVAVVRQLVGEPDLPLRGVVVESLPA